MRELLYVQTDRCRGTGGILRTATHAIDAKKRGALIIRLISHKQRQAESIQRPIERTRTRLGAHTARATNKCSLPLKRAKACARQSVRAHTIRHAPTMLGSVEGLVGPFAHLVSHRDHRVPPALAVEPLHTLLLPDRNRTYTNII